MIKFFVAKGPEQGRTFVLNGNTAQIGRSSDNAVSLSESSVSRNHAKIYWEDDRYYIEDLQSRNGTWINGHAIASGEKVQVQEGVPIALGNVLVSVGRKCSLTQMPNEYSVSIQQRVDEVLKPPAFAERRAKQETELRLIYDVSVNLLGSLDLTELGERVLDSIFGCLKRIDSCFVFLVEPESSKLKKMASRFREGRRTAGRGYSRSLVRRVAKEGKAVMMPNTAKENKTDLSDSMEKMGVKSVICVPLVSRAGTRGVIYLQSVNTVHSFRKSDLFLLTALSTPMALAFENALLYSKSRQAEEKLREASDHLEKEVMSRTADLRKAKEKLEQLSTMDGLSGLHNYRYLIHSLESEFRRAVRYRHALTLLLIDIDYFKNLNDTYGHLFGDYVIKTVGKILKNNVRATDVVARYGGDELAVILIETGTKSALEVAEKLKQEIGSYPFQWRKKQPSVNVSIGLATAPAHGIQEVSGLVDAADRALYHAKNAGRNTVVVFGQNKKITSVA